MEIQAKVESLQPILGALREKAAECGLTCNATHQLEIALEELIVNIIQHAYQNSQKSVNIEFSKLGSQFCVKVQDWAPPFNLIKEIQEVEGNSNLLEHKLGGFGLLFIKKFTDYLEYRTIEGGNEVKLFKKI